MGDDMHQIESEPAPGLVAAPRRGHMAGERAATGL